MKLPVSLTIITLNEEKSIARCIQSASWAQEVIVVDSGSQDQTREIAKSLGAKVFVEKWRGYGAQKAFAADQAVEGWILSLDADEALSPELSAEIVEKFAELKPDTGYEFPRKSFYLGRWIMHGGWYPDYQLRLFHRSSAQWAPHEIHERVVAPKTARFKNPLQHYVFQNVSEQVDTNNRYSTLQAEQHFKKAQKFSYLKLIVKPISKFLECYFWKLGFLDGLPGFIIAVGAAHSVFIRWSKVWELQRK